MEKYDNTSPQMCGYYSMTTDRIFEPNASSLKYFNLPKVPLDLNAGISDLKKKPDSYYDEKMDSLLSYIVENKSKLIRNKTDSRLIPSTKYITFRGVIRMIMCSPYETRSGWCILATRYKGNIYLCQLTVLEKRLAIKNEPFSSKRFQYYGPKFEQCCLSESLTSLQYFKPPNRSIDLNEGIDLIADTHDAYSDEKMEHILQYISNHKDKFLNPSVHRQDKDVAVNFITYRGVIRMIMCSPYEQRKGWCILATKYKGNIYLCQYKNSERREADRNESAIMKNIHKHGIKLEQCCLVDDPSQMPDTSARVDECAQFFCVFQRKLVGRNFLFAGEMDGVISDTPVNLDDPESCKDIKFIELKVSASPHQSSNARRNFEKYKCQNVWTQSFLTGVNDIYFGFRDGKGIVERIDSYKLDELYQNWKNYSDPTKCFDFLDDFLKLVESRLQNIDCPDTVLEFNYDEKTREISNKFHHGKTELSLLPDWYLKALNP